MNQIGGGTLRFRGSVNKPVANLTVGGNAAFLDQWESVCKALLENDVARDVFTSEFIVGAGVAD